jgi:uncharacterized membrane protein YdjX (TVP38/TMEM64 family)
MPEFRAINTANWKQALLRSFSGRRARVFLITSVLVLAGALFAGKEVGQHLDGVGKWIAESGPWASAAFVLVFVVLSSVLVPDTLLCVLAGALFHWTTGFVSVLAGLVLGGIVQYFLSRGLLRSRIDRALSTRPFLAAIREAVHYDELHLQFLLRLAPLNPATLSYLLGAAGVRFPGFLLTMLATAPNLAFAVYLGHIGKHAAGLQQPDQEAAHMERIFTFGGLGVALVVVFFISRAARRAVTRAIEKSKAEHPEITESRCAMTSGDGR